MQVSDNFGVPGARGLCRRGCSMFAFLSFYQCSLIITVFGVGKDLMSNRPSKNESIAPDLAPTLQ